MSNLIITNGTLLTMDRNRRTIRDAIVVVEGNRITAVGETCKLKKEYKADKVINANGKLVMPGFVNAHTHVMKILLRGGLGQDRKLYDWLLNLSFPGILAYRPDDARIAATMYCVEALRSGITTILDTNTSVIEGEKRHASGIDETAISVYKETGIRAIYARMFLPEEIELDKSKLGSGTRTETVHHSSNSAGTADILKDIEKMIRKHHRSENGRIHIWPSPTKPDLGEEGLLGSLELARKYDVMTTIHLAETQADMNCFGMSAVEYLSRIGFLDPRVLAAHCVWVSDRDLEMLRLNDVKVAHNAVPNMFLADGIAPIPKMLRLGLTVGIGTDDPNCNDAVNMISDMKFVALIHKVSTLDAAAMTSEKVLEMATIDGARAIGLGDEIGSIEVGKKADIIILDMNRVHLRPCHHLPSTLVYQAYGHEVETTIVDGKILMDNRSLSFIGEDGEKDLSLKAQHASEGILERAGLNTLRKRVWGTLA